MRIILSPELPDEKGRGRAFTDPLGVCSSAVARSRFSPEQQALLAKLADFSVPHLTIRGAFDARHIKATTPDRMAVEVPEAEIAVNSMLHTFGAAQLRPVSFSYENDGQLFVNLAAQRQSADDQKGFEKSVKAQRGHTDASYSPSPDEYYAGGVALSPSPDFVALGCIRNKERVPTRIALLSDVVANLSTVDIENLCRPLFVLSPQASFALPRDSWRFGSVLWMDQRGILCCRCSHSQIAADEDSQKAAFDALHRFLAAIAHVSSDHVLEPGEILVFNNRTVIHGRGAIGSPWKPDGRWLLRGYAYRRDTGFDAENAMRPWIVT